MYWNHLLKRVSRMTVPSTKLINQTTSSSWSAARSLLCGVIVCASFSGCQMGLDFENFNKFVSRESYLYPDGADLSDAPKPTIGGNMKLPEFLGGKKDESPRYRKAANAQANAEFRQAETLFQKKEYKQAEKRFKKIAKRYNDTTLEEDSLFMVAESQFMRKRYSYAQDSYDTLLDEFPSSQYVAKSTARLFTIARTWLQFPEVVTSNGVKQVDFNNPKKEPTVKKPNRRTTDITRIVPIIPNLFDRSRPLMDTDGRALEALKSIWLNDPTGALADDALMLAASHHLREEEYMEADRLYKILREEYPKSPHLKDAFDLGSHVKLMSYQGGSYDAKPLEESGKLKQASLRLFRNGDNQERLQAELNKIAQEKAAHEWENVIYWEKKGLPESVAVYCQVVMDEYPESKYAEMARKKLVALRRTPQPKTMDFSKT